MFDHSFPHKICDPIHGFIRFDATEKQVIDSRPFQRLRYLHQMGPAYLVYPGATHRRFEHSLGVMELATRIYDTLISSHTLNREILKGKSSKPIDFFYWRRIIRLAALCHDMGHLPFSHTAEKELLPQGGHELMTIKLIQSEELQSIWKNLGPDAKADILKLSVQENELIAFGMGLRLSPWEKVLSKIITEDNFGADRIDYLIRDAQHTGVGYGHFDYHQLIDTLRILPNPEDKEGLTIGISLNGIQSIESLWIARYLMYARVYHHSKVRLFSHHLRRFMIEHYEKVGFPKTLEDYLFETDTQVLAAISQCSRDNHFDAQVLMKQREPFKEIPLDAFSEEKITKAMDNLRAKFGANLFVDVAKGGRPKNELRKFWVLKEDGTIASSVDVSQFLRDIPLGGKSVRLYADPSQAPVIHEWLKN